MILVRECGHSKVSWFWRQEANDYIKREACQTTVLTPEQYLKDVLDYPKARSCDGLQKWIEAGRPQ